MTFWEIYVSLCSKNGASPNAVAKELNISSGSVTWWKKGKIPHFATLKKIADYFGVTVDYLLGKEKIKKSSSDTDEDIIETIRKHNKGKAQIFFCGANGRVVDVPEEAESLILNLIETLDKKK